MREDKEKYTARRKRQPLFSLPNTWFQLDNAAKVFPGTNTSKWSNIFRFSIVLKERVDVARLKKALEQTLPRFPCFAVRMRKGMFWYYLEHNPLPAPPILEDVSNPCTRVKWRENDRFLFRVYYYESRISVEFYHALTDAYGATRFLATLTACYLNMGGADIPASGAVLDWKEEASEEELEDAFRRFANSHAKLKKKKGFVYQVKGERLPAHTMQVLTGYMPVAKLKQQAKQYDVTVTEFLSALLLDILYQKQKREENRQKPLSVQIPVNLRNTFPSRTLRNFSLTYHAYIDPNMGDYSFTEILQQVSLYLRYTNNAKELNAMMTANLKLESNPFMRAAPLPIKNLGIGIAFLLKGERTNSVLLSNLGVVDTPPEMDEYIDRMLLMTGPGLRNTARFACMSYQDTLALSMASIFRETDIPRELFTRLVKMGIPVKVESNH